MSASIRGSDWQYSIEPLKNSGSEDMNVDGSVSNVTFKYTVPSNETWYLESIKLFLLDSGTMSYSNFGSIATLTNGLKIQINKNTNDYTIRDVTCNMHILEAFPHNVITGSNTGAFLESNDYFCGSMQFKEDIRLTDGDKVKIVVKDDLTAIDVLRSQIIIKRAI